MKKTVKRILLVVAGVVIGVAASQALLVSASRPAGVVGAEVVIPLALPTLLAIGWWVGRDTPRVDDYNRGWHDGHQKGVVDAMVVMLQPSGKHRPYDFEKDTPGL